MTKTKHPHRYKLYIGGTLTLSLCAVILGFSAGTWGGTTTSILSLIMIAMGGLWYHESTQNKSIKTVEKNVETLSSQQDEMISDIEQMRKFVDITKKTPVPPSSLRAKQTRSKPPTKPSIKPVKPRQEQEEDMPPHYSDTVIEELIHNALAKRSVDVFLQPIVTLPHRRAVMMEIFTRLRVGNGYSLPASHYMRISIQKNLQVRLDNLLLQQGLDSIRQDIKKNVHRSYMLNIEDHTLKDSDFMSHLLAFLKNNVQMSHRLVFEMKQSTFTDMPQGPFQILKALSKLGCGISMDQVDTPHIESDLIRDLGVRYIKIAGDRLKDFASHDEGLNTMRRIKNSLATDGISIIADKIEDEKTLCELLDLEIDYGQGYLFGKPDREIAYEHLRKTA